MTLMTTTGTILPPQSPSALQRRFKTWRDAADHHKVAYLGIAIKMEPVGLRAAWTIVKERAVQTWFITPRGNTVRVTYRRVQRFAGRRIEIIVNNGTPLYFGPNDYGALKSLVISL
jgi:hypothetical protein